MQVLIDEHLRALTKAEMMITEQDVQDLTDAITNAVDDWVRAGGGSYDELQAVVEKAILEIVNRTSHD